MENGMQLNGDFQRTFAGSILKGGSDVHGRRSDA